MNVQCPNCFENYDSDLGVCPHCGYTAGDKAKESAHMNPGTVVNNRYHIGKVLGYGGFGVTYLAWDAVLNARVAIKEYLPSEFSTRTEGDLKVSVFTDERENQYYAGLVKFMDEAKRVAKFHGESGIVGVSDAFMENNTAYMVMELLEGETLKTFLAREGVMSVDTAIGLLTPVIHSLKAVHDAGIIHRDIAPDNIMITKSGEVKLIDFGAARYAAAPKKTIIVKPGFSPLEQYQSKAEQGSYTDVFALASVLYYMITGIMPSDSLARQASIEKGMKDPLQAPSTYVKNISPNVETAILNALNLHAKDRTQDMETFFNELTGPETVKRRAEKTKKIDVLKWPLWAKIAVPVGGVAVITALVLFFSGVIGFNSGLQTKISIPDGMVRVPSVVNDDTDTAENKLTDVNLSYLISGKSYSEVIDSDYVLTQDTASGTVVMQNTIVGVTVSKGVETSYVEDVTLIDEEEATSILEDAGFVVVISMEYSKAVAEGSVISQSVEKDTELAVGSEVTLTVSAGIDYSEVEGDKDTEVPDFSGMTYEEALTEAENAGVALSVTDRTYTDEADTDTVLEQSVDAGEEVSVGTVVELSASLGEEYVRTEDVQYETEEKAVAELDGLNVQVEYEESTTVKEGLVISQSIDAGEKADPEEEITITVSTGAPKFDMPDVTWENIDDVQKILNEDGLVVYISYEHDEAEDEGTVLDQSIYPGEQVSAGTEVTLTVSTKDEVIYVEDVVGEYADSAEETLTEQGFKVIFSDVNGEEVTDTADSNLIVISQLPRAESGQKEGTTIVLTVGDEVSAQTQAEICAEGKCGNNLTWTLYENGTLVISGTGEMYDYEETEAPWFYVELEYMDESYFNYSYANESVFIVVLEEGVTSIGNYAFCDCAYLESVELPTTLLSIGEEAFWHCYNLMGIDIPDSVISIGELAFGSCWELASLTMSEGVTSIGRRAFDYCNSLASIDIPLSVTDMGDSVFYGWTSDQTIYINGRTEAASGWDEEWKYDCEATIVWDGEIYDDGTDIAYEVDETETEEPDEVSSEYEYPIEGVCGDNLTWTLDADGLLVISGTGDMYDFEESLDYEGAYGPWLIYDGIKEIHIDDGVTSIGNYAFYNYSFDEITISNSVTRIGDHAFDNCWGVTSINIPNSVISIGDWAFCACGDLTNINIPNSVTSIGERAFYQCRELASITIPSSVTDMGVGAFYLWSASQTIYVEGYTAAPSGWHYDWNLDSDAKIVWGADGDTVAEEQTEEAGETETAIYTGVDATGMLGDVNMDGAIDYLDVLVVERYEAGEIYLDDAQLAAGDVNSDGSVDYLDAELIRKYDEGLIYSF